MNLNVQAGFSTGALARRGAACYADFMKSMARIILLVVTALLLGIVPLLSAGAARAEGGNPPLVVIRFNQERVYFDQQLYSAISKAVAIKPELLLEVVSLAPSTGNAEIDRQWQAAASSHTQSVVVSLQSMGVPASRIQVSGQLQPGLRYDETHVFVR